MRRGKPGWQRETMVTIEVMVFFFLPVACLVMGVLWLLGLL